jgi:Zn-dependent peptidase ImmA (M78 family)
MFDKNVIAVANAKKIINELYISFPKQYTIPQIINARGLTYREAELTGSVGNIIFNNVNGVVTVSSGLKLETQKVFTAAHELGHFENEKLKFKSCTFTDVFGINVNASKEAAANDFAAELLMHEPWFLEFTGNKKLNIKLLSNCAEHFSVSLSAVAIRYAEIGTVPSAILLSTKGIVKWRHINKNFPYQFLRPGLKVHEMSYAFDLHDTMLQKAKGNFSYDEMKQKLDKVPAEEDIPAYAWFDEDFTLRGNREIRIMEANFPMHNYESVLTLLWEYIN